MKITSKRSARSDLCAQRIVDTGHDQLTLRVQCLAYQLPFTQAHRHPQSRRPDISLASGS